MRRTQAELYFRSSALLGEGPVWDDGVLYWTDIKGKALFSKRDDQHFAERYEMPCEVGALALWGHRSAVLATRQGFQGFDFKSRSLELWSNPEASQPENRLNDGKCDPRGRFLAGTMSKAGDRTGALYVLDKDKTARKIFGPVACSNGLAWSESGTTLYYIDTPTRVVRSFAYDLEHGRMSDERIAIEIPADRGKPDGMTIDCEGNLWISLWGGGAVECWSPHTGNLLARIAVPVPNVTSCVFGGLKYDRLFVTTARTGQTEHTAHEEDDAGSIFCATPGVTGRPAVHFRCGT